MRPHARPTHAHHSDNQEISNMKKPTSTIAHNKTSHCRRLVAGVLVAVLPLATLACGNSAATATDAAEAGSQQATQDSGASESADDLQQCLAENGIELGTPPAGSDGEGGAPAVDDEALQQAQEACGDLMQRGDGFQGGEMNSEALQEWTACLAENGVELDMPAGGAPGRGGEQPDVPADGERPEPPAGGEQPAGGTPFGLDTSDPEVAAAVAACDALQPQMGDRPGGAGSTAPEASTES